LALPRAIKPNPKWRRYSVYKPCEPHERVQPFAHVANPTSTQQSVARCVLASLDASTDDERSAS
jgi:hypothetical protein